MREFTIRAARQFVGASRIYLLLLIGTLVICSDFRLIATVYEKDSIPMLFFIPAYLVAFFSAASLLLHRITWIRTVIQILVFSSLYTDILYLIIGDFPFSYPDAINLINNPEYASGALMTFSIALLLAFAATAIIYAGIHFSVKRLPRSNVPASVFIFVTMQLFLIVASKKYTGIYDFFPSVYRVGGNLLAANRFRPEEQWRRTAVLEKPGKIHVKHLFIVVDESVTGDALSINGFPLPTSPFLQANAAKFINFGTAVSFTNFSAGSNLSLMSGMLPQELPDRKFISFAKPSVFQYAKRAGYQTYLLDAQTTGKKLQNYTSTQDLYYIDSLFQPAALYPTVPVYGRDSVLVDKMVMLANREVPTFAYVNKAGAHWPYHTNVPRDSIANLSDVFGNEAENAATYFKSLFWNVDRFWKMLASKLPANSQVLILYTSDHGENYAALPVKIKHASIYKTPPIEGRVPLLAYDRSGFFPENFRPPLNKYAHRYIFPTLLSAMGYNKGFTETLYGRSLRETPYPQRRWFQAGDLFGRGKTRRVFVE